MFSERITGPPDTVCITRLAADEDVDEIAL
jgi:hypothetical protein